MKNKKHAPKWSINYSQKGITLISLIITVTLLIILTGVAIKGMTGKEGIIASSKQVANEYKEQQNKEYVEQLIRSKILEDALTGKEPTIKDIIEELEKDGKIKDVIEDPDTGTITVITDDGTKIEVNYDPDTGDLDTDPIGGGTNNKEDVPKMTVKYIKDTKTIQAVVSCNDGIEKVELIHEGKTKETIEGKGAKEVTANYKNITVAGTYKIVATSSKGITRSAYVTVKAVVTALKAPKIEIITGQRGDNDWYKSKVKIKNNGEETGGAKLKYIITGQTIEEDKPEEGLTKEKTIRELGLTKIIAWVESADKTQTSEKVYQNIKIDNVAPNTPEIEIIEGEAGNAVEGQGTQKWYVTDLKLKITGKDANSGIAGYEYTVRNTHTGKTIIDGEKLKGESKEITIKADGIYEIKVQATDKAGNKSNILTKTIYKDATEPDEFAPTISGITSKGFTIIAYTDDNLSGIDRYKYYIDGKNVYEGENKKFDFQGEGNTAYGVKVEAYDKAGNMRKGMSTSANTEAEDTIPPVVMVTKGEITTNSIQVSVTATDQGSGLASEPEYTYYIKKTSEPEYRKVAENIKDAIYIYKNLEQATAYDIKIEVADGAGNIGSGAIRIITTLGIPGGDTEGIISYTEPTWESGKAKTTISTNQRDYWVQYKVVKEGQNEKDIQWNTIQNKGEGITIRELEHNDTVYARLWDGVNGGTNKPKEIKDETPPTIEIEKTSTTTNSIQVRITKAEDKQSGLQEPTTYTYYYKKASEAEYTKAENGETTNTSYTYEGLENNIQYDIKVEVKDKADNIGKAELKGTSGIKTEEIPDASKIEGAIAFSEVAWENGKAKTTISTNQTNYYIQYKIGENGQWNTSTTKGQNIETTQVTSGTTIYARLWDGTSGGKEKELEIKDETAPEITITSESMQTSVSFTATDAQSGIIAYKVTTENTEPTSGWTNVTNTKNLSETTVTGLEYQTTYYIWVKDSAGNAGQKSFQTVGEFTVTYNYSENGGTSATKETAKVIVGQGVDLSVTATKANWTFVGWNTDKDAETALTSYTMPANNVTLYAIYSKTLTVTYHTYNNQTNTAQVTLNNKQSSGTVALPSIENVTVDEVTYTPRGWSTATNADASTTNAGTNITVTTNTDYYASYNTNITATFYYNSNTTSGNLTQATETATGTRQMNYTGTKKESNLTVPTAVSSSKGKYRADYRGVASSINTLDSTTTPTTASTTYYTTYSTDVTIYYPTSETTSTSEIKHRNEYFTGENAMNTVLANDETSTQNYTLSNQASGYSIDMYSAYLDGGIGISSSDPNAMVNSSYVSWTIKMGKRGQVTVYYNTSSESETFAPDKKSFNVNYQLYARTDRKCSIV